QLRGIDGEDERSELIFTVAAHGVRAAGVEAFARMQHVAVYPIRCKVAGGLKRFHPSSAQMSSDHGLANLPVQRCFAGGAIVAEVGERVPGRVLEVRPRGISV